MKILFVNSFYNLFAKADCGASQRSMCVIRALSKLGDVDVVSFADETVSNIPGVEVIYSKNVEDEKHHYSVVQKIGRFFCWWKPEWHYPVNEQKREVIDRIVAQKDYDVIVTRYLKYACECGLMRYADRLVLDFDDDLRDSVLMEIAQMKSWRKRIKARIYAETVGRLTAYVSKHIRHGFYSAPHRPLPNADFLPNISAYTEPIPEVDFRATKPVVLLVGNFRYYPNEYGLERFVRDIFPKIRELIVDAEVHVVGNIPDYMMERIQRYMVDGVELCGFVPQLTDAYKDSRCVVVPIWHGTGTSVKLVEAMALNRAVVTTTMGVRGLHEAFVQDEDYLLEDEDRAIAENVVRLLTDEKLNNRLSKSALGKIQEYYSTERFEAIIREQVEAQS